MFNKIKLVISAITGLIALIASVYVSIINKNDDQVIGVIIGFGIAMMYSNYRWIDGYLEKKPEASWRRLPWFLDNEPVLNVYCLNTYKWVLMIFLLGFILTKFM